MRGPGTGVLLARAISASAARAGLTSCVEAQGDATWQSATFDGQRFALALTAPAGAAAHRWLETLGTLDVPLPGALLADLAVTAQSDRDGQCHARIEALTVAQN